MACLVATAKADGWDDFANNLATDLAPILALFGEQATKQFLSESTTRLDNFIFAMAPLGILTAVVSAIRVCGGPSLRAFIGRAQEGGGIAEAELCSSTSRDVCELYHNGAIVRVFGRPKILEIVHDREAPCSFDTNSKTVPDCGIYPFQEYIKTQRAKDAGWKELGEPNWSVEGQPLKVDKKDDVFAPNPNLSFNIGIREQPRWVVRLAATAGFLIQASVVVFGFLVTYTWGWTKEDAAPSSWAFPLMVAGTFLLNSGMFHCAYLVESSTQERIFQRAPGNKKKGPRFHVIQPGNQTIGDQTFDAFSFTDAHDSHRLNKYTTSWKINEEAKLGVWLATGSSICGFVLQFVGLRSMHSAVSVLQLGAILFMTIVRAGLRTQRLGKDQNLLRSRPDEVEGHELDWLALEMAKDDQEKKNDERKFWSVIATRPKSSSPSANHESEPPSHQMSSNIAAEKHQAEKVFLYRSRLAELTSHSTRKKSKVSSAWDDSMVHVRQQARQLKKAIESSAKVLFTHSRFEPEWESNKTITWAFDVAETSLSNSGPNKKDTSTIRLTLHKVDDGKQSNVWEINQKYLEAVVGLWAWSMISDPETEEEEKELRISTASEVPMSRIMAFGVSQEDTERAKTDLELWMEDFPSTTSTMKWMKPPGLTDKSPNTIWKRDVDEMVHNLKLEADHCLDRVRLYGWQIPSIPAEMHALTTTVNGSLPDMCARDVYQSFLRTITEGLTSVEGQSKPSMGSKDYYFTNDVLSRLAECFKESGLGSIRDAYSIIVPVLRSKLPLPVDVLPTAYSQAESCRKEGDFQKAEAILRWGWDTALKTTDDLNNDALDACMLEFGELYRYALFSNDSSQHGLGFDGISWMQKEVQKSPEKSSIAAVANRYFHLADMARRDSTPQCSADDVVAAASKNDRPSCLWLISRVMGLSSTSIDRTALSWAAQRGWSEIVKAAIEIGSVIDSEDGSRRTPLSYAAEHGHADVVEILVRSGAVPNLEDATHRTPLSYAVAGGHIPVVELLLKDRRVSIFTRDKYDNSLLHWAATNGHNDIVDFLLKREVEDQLNQPNVHRNTPLALALSNSHTSTADLLVGRGPNVDGIMIHDAEALEWTIKNGEWASAAWLLRLSSNEDKAVIIGLFEKQDPKEPIPYGMPDTRSPVISLEVKALVDALSVDANREITMEIIQDFLVGKYFVQAKIWKQEGTSQEILSSEGNKVVELLLSLVRKQDVVTVEVLKAAAGYEYSGEEVVKLLLDHRGQEITITEEIVRIAAANEGWLAENVLILLLDERGQEITITEDIVKAAAENQGDSTTEIMNLLFNERGEEITITEEIVKAAAANRAHSEKVFNLLLNRRGQEIVITGEILKAAVSNEGWSAVEVMKLLLDQRGHEFTVTEEVVKAVAGNQRSGEDMMKLLLDQCGHEFTVTEEIVKIVAGNGVSGGKVMKLLLDRRGHEFTVTEEIVKIVAGNAVSGGEVMKLLLDQRGHEFMVTEEIVKAAAENEDMYGEGETMMDMFLDQRGHEFTVTEEVLKAVAGNRWSPTKMIGLLLDGRAHIQLTEGMKEIIRDEGYYL
ncbi:hypothetical protein PFICI_00211 [Pestalotiopsis fici W106-1]|uniref:Uncharacterized protein n=1 Tax=Pestalotiopsis fici (strain W106-1 / CGMCC3.15140) TaxID=1229662 RepID=W3XK17_PESFW|nr:uncharacterized protein PFICI_00211 [Pestalotiopsis fici W106-1]ETS86383.1 hypothetical protein PFICI_00211 [Pestalotiopsis fici W106-1]